ncbi:redoxin domain-containing protein [Chryseosolibacter indicus]|uniref:TlpA family protein disulfide reductase n=1 Tax=Chryseosolibacter indicus TaxID=2782351 RepID=A0ABS5VSQ1_9BACT|nr:redoxin domain-containing protein [Chryseosolibacter indicus]MBT1704457.1 TlpA family protein disulfide reductase [Chryseosolibacter indicus]
MKKITTLVFTILMSINVSIGQTPGLNIGDEAPLLSVYKWIRGTPTCEYTEGRIYVIEFGATWCTPCAAAIPVLSDVSNKYRNEVSVISVFVKENFYSSNKNDTSYIDKVKKYVDKKSDQIHYSVAIDDPLGRTGNAWLKGRDGIPHIFIVDKQGKISFIGSNPKDIYKVLEKIRSDSYNIKDYTTSQRNVQANRVKFDPAKLLLIDGNGGREDSFLWRSILTRYDGEIHATNPEFISSYYWAVPGSKYFSYKDRVQLIGVSLSKLYYLAYGDTLSNVVHFRGMNWEFPDTVAMPHLKTSYGKYWHEPVLEVNDQKPFIAEKSNIQNRYNYSLKVPKGKGTSQAMQNALRNDLETYFGYDVSVEVRMMPYWRLTAPDRKFASSKLLSKDQNEKIQVTDSEAPFVFRNAKMRDVITMLASTFGYGLLDFGKLPLTEQAPFIDETGIAEDIDFIFDKRATFDEAKEHLKKLGLDLSKSTKPMKVVVIKNSVEGIKNQNQ